VDGQLQTLLAEVFGLRPAEVHMDLAKEDVARWDSLRQMDLVMTLEGTYSVTLEIVDIVRMGSVAEIVTVLSEKGVTLGD
jgi:acyl carrier protein